jgi:hypothetical protein
MAPTTSSSSGKWALVRSMSMTHFLLSVGAIDCRQRERFGGRWEKRFLGANGRRAPARFIGSSHRRKHWRAHGNGRRETLAGVRPNSGRNCVSCTRFLRRALCLRHRDVHADEDGNKASARWVPPLPITARPIWTVSDTKMDRPARDARVSPPQALPHPFPVPLTAISYTAGL